MRSIEEIKREKARYEKKIEDLNKELRNLSIKTTRTKRKKSEKRKTPFSEGDRVVITNDYKGKKGTEGSVTRSIGDFTFLQDKYGAVHQRAHHNLDKVKDHE